jgi:hypothetical protein
MNCPRIMPTAGLRKSRKGWKNVDCCRDDPLLLFSDASNASNQLRMDTKQILERLGNNAHELDWDECWDLLLKSTDASEETVSLLVNALHGSTQIIKLSALAKLRQLQIEPTRWVFKLNALLADEDAVVRREALEAARPFLSAFPVIREAVLAMSKTRKEFITTRFKAWQFLRKT